MTHYQPIKDRDGAGHRCLFVGLDFSDGLVALKKKVLAMRLAPAMPMRWIWARIAAC
jgi:methyl-accepting chemotaxis protein-2 (aspartate sensor receptor)